MSCIASLPKATITALWHHRLRTLSVGGIALGAALLAIGAVVVSGVIPGLVFCHVIGGAVMGLGAIFLALSLVTFIKSFLCQEMPYPINRRFGVFKVAYQENLKDPLSEITNHCTSAEIHDMGLSASYLCMDHVDKGKSEIKRNYRVFGIHKEAKTKRNALIIGTHLNTPQRSWHKYEKEDGKWVCIRLQKRTDNSQQVDPHYHQDPTWSEIEKRDYKKRLRSDLRYIELQKQKKETQASSLRRRNASS